MLTNSELLKRFDEGDISSLEFDTLWESMNFVPDEIYLAARPNAAGTKIIYFMADGSQQTCWAADWHLIRDELRH